jgi:hypothetical protein
MLPSKVVEYVQGPFFQEIGTRDARLFPDVAFGCGATADPAEDTVTIFLPDAYNARCLHNLRDNGQVAVLLGHGEGHETFQLKGLYLSDRPTTEREQAIQDIYVKKALAYWHNEYSDHTEKYFNGLVRFPSTAVTFRVTDIFDQTPGPGAGKRLEF